MQEIRFVYVNTHMVVTELRVAWGNKTGKIFL